MAVNKEKLTNENILKAVGGVLPLEYKERFKTLIDSNLLNVNNLIEQYPTLANEFINTMIDKVVMSKFFNRLYESHFKLFHKGEIDGYGKTIEEIFVDLIEGKDFTEMDGGSEASDLLSIKKPSNIKTLYISENVRWKYKVSYSKQQIKRAFTTKYGLINMIDEIVKGMVNSAKFDEENIIRGLLNKSDCKVIEIKEPVDEVTAKQFLKTIRATATKLGYMSSQYNKARVNTHTPRENLVLITTADVESCIDVEALAYSFNVDKAEFKGRVIPVPDFGADKDTFAMLVDKDYIQFYETLNESDSQKLANQLAVNMFLHRWYNANLCHFANAIKFKKPKTSVGTVSSGTVGKSVDTSKTKTEEVKESK